MNEYEMPKCTCGEELEFDDDTDLYCDGSLLTMASYGHCPKCEKEYRWNDYYVLSYWGDLEEVTE